MTRSPSFIGKKRHRITLLTPLEIPNDQGGAALTWQPGLTLWGKIEGLMGREIVEGESLGGRVETRITLRWRNDVSANQRLANGARIFAIRAAFDPDGTRRDLTCLCEEIPIEEIGP